MTPQECSALEPVSINGVVYQVCTAWTDATHLLPPLSLTDAKQIAVAATALAVSAFLWSYMRRL